MNGLPGEKEHCARWSVRALKLLIRTTLLWWGIAVGLLILRIVPPADPMWVGSADVGAWILGATGAVCFAICRGHIDTAGVLLQALKASHSPDDGRHLAAVPELPQATGSSTQPGRRSAH